MDQLNSILTIITNGIKNPYLAIAGVVASLFGYFFYQSVKQKIRTEQAQTHKEEAKADDINELERQTAEANNNARDRLAHRKTN